MKNYSILFCFCLLGKIGWAQDLTTQITHVQGGQLGAIDLTMLGGYPPYDFIWTGPNNFRAFTEDISGLQSGQYCVDVSDAHCGTLNWCVIVEECRPMIARLRQSVPCQGQNNGSITAVTASTARQPLRYQWSNGQTTQTAPNLEAGFHSVTVTDAVGCTDSRSEMLLPQTILVEGIVQNACTNGRSTGGVQLQADIIPMSWSSMLSFRWSNGSTEQNLTGVNAGTYTVTVNSDRNCTQTARFEVRNLFEENVSVQLGDKENNSYCDRTRMDCDGSIDLVVTRTDRPLSFNWSGPNGFRTGQRITDLCAGRYLATVRDPNGCQMTLPPIDLCCCENDFEPDINRTASNSLACSNQIHREPTVTLVPQSPDDSNQNTGSIQLNITGNPNYIGGYTIRWEGPGVTGSSARTLTGLGVGRYCVTVKDGCHTVEQCVTLVACKEQPITITGTARPSCECSTNTTSCNIGSIQNVTVTGGTTPYNYQWSNGSRNQNLSNLAAGQYCVTVTAANGCQQTKCFTVSSTPLVEKANPVDCSWVDKVCPINNQVIQFRVRQVGSTLVENRLACALNRRCMDGTIQVVAMGISIVRLNRVLLRLDGSRICADITECAMPNGDGSLQPFIPSLIIPKPNRRVEIGVRKGGCNNWDYQIDYYCGNVLMDRECIPQIAGRDTSEISLSILPEPLERLNRSHTNRMDDLFYTLPENTIVRTIDSVYIIEPKIVPKRNTPNNPIVDTSASYSVETIFPNPFQENISINLTVGSASEIQFKLVNLLGKVVFEQKQSLSKGFYQLVLEMPFLPAGVYNFEIVSEDGTQKQVQKLVHL